MTTRPEPAVAVSAAAGQGAAQRIAAAARRRVRVLRDRGGTYRSIAQAAGLAPMTVHALAAGQARPRLRTAVALLSLTPAALATKRADAGGTRLRLRALHVMGHGSARIARAGGASPDLVRAVTRGDTATVSIRLRDSVVTVYEAWWDKRAPETTPAELAAVTRARRRAIRSDWCAPAALDDDQLDTPGYRPAHGWLPAAGTGTAGAITPPAPGTMAGGPLSGRLA